MRKLMLSLMLLGLTNGLIAQQQLLNGNFEDTVVTTGQGNFSSPRHWTNSGFGAGISTDAQEGKFAAVIWNWYYYGKGVLSNGFYSSSDAGGTPVTFRPEKLSGYYKYIIGEVKSTNDSAIVFVTLTRYNSQMGKRDTVGYGMRRLGAANTYRAFETPINYTSAAQPDTVVVRFLSSESGFCNSQDGNCLYLYLDDIKLSSNTTGISEGLKYNAFQLYPNPVKQYVELIFPINTATVLEIYNLMGECVFTKKLEQSNYVRLNLDSLQPGIYFLSTDNGFIRKFVKE